MGKRITITTLLLGWAIVFAGQVPWQQIDMTSKTIPWPQTDLSGKPIPWDDPGLTGKPVPSDLWMLVDLTGPEYKAKDRRFPWWVLTPLAGVPLLFLWDTGDEDEPVLPPDITCIDITVEWDVMLPPVDPSSVEVVNYCPDGDVTVIHLGDVSNNGTGCADDPLVISRSYQVSDACGNSNSCTQQITLIDTQPPTVITPATDVAVECDGQGNPVDIEAWLNNNGGAAATDTHGSITWSNDYAGGPGGCGESVAVTFTATDICGNTMTTAASFTITDNMPPDITCPPDLTVACDGVIDPSSTGTATAVDNCSPPEVITIDYTDNVSELTGCNGTGVMIRTWSATDACGNNSNCEQLITVVDDTVPAIACPVDITILCADPATPEITGSPIVEDNCGTVTVNFTDVVEGDCPGTITRTFTAVDECGNTSVCIQVISIVIMPPAESPQDLALTMPWVSERTNLPDWRNWHQEHFNPEPVKDWLESWSVEHPLPDLYPVFTYVLGVPVSTGLHYPLTERVQLRWSVSTMLGNSRAETDPLPGMAPVTLSSAFRTWTNDLAVRRYGDQLRWVPFAGLGFRWHRLEVEDSRVQWSDREVVLPDGYHHDQWEGFLTSGFRLKLGYDFYLELEGEWRYLNPGGQTFGLRPQVGTEIRWRF